MAPRLNLTWYKSYIVELWRSEACCYCYILCCKAHVLVWFASHLDTCVGHIFPDLFCMIVCCWAMLLKCNMEES